MKNILPIFYLLLSVPLIAQDPAKVTLDRIYASGDFRQDYQSPINWIEGGESYIIVERNEQKQRELVKYETKSQKRSVFLSASQLTPNGASKAISIENFSMSIDETKVLIFNNSRRVWRTNTKGDYWVYDLTSNKLTQIGKSFPSSSLMFAKFSGDNKYVAYVMDFNLYMENFITGEITQLTHDGNGDIINGTFDWVYEEEFGCRDGFRWSPNGTRIAFWQLDASTIGTFHMINNTDSVYSRLIPLQYPKVGQDPSSAKVAWIDINSGALEWIELKGSDVQNYIPRIQWVNDQLLLLMQINRKQNHLKIWAYDLTSKNLRLVYEEKEETWVDIEYPDVSASHWSNSDIQLVDESQSFVRLAEDDWRTAYKVDIESGEIHKLSDGTYDVASLAGLGDNSLYFIASPDNSTQRYLYSTSLSANGEAGRITPENFKGINTYQISPNGKYAIHKFQNTLSPTQVHLISLPDHKVIKTLVSNERFSKTLKTLDLPEVEFKTITTQEGIEVDTRIIKPVGYKKKKKYPVIIHVYGEPWGQSAKDAFIGTWNIMLAQMGYFVIDIDNRGTPCLKGSEWRKSIYRNIGRINIKDMAQVTQELVKLPSLDQERVGVWGWSGGGASTLNLMFQYPKVFKTGVAVAFVSNQLTYDNIYQERYMGLPQENKEDFIVGSPLNYAKNLEGDLLLIHGTGDDNVHYQNMDMLVNELIKHNKQFDMMSYPNRSHGIYEGRNTRRHLYTLITNYFMENLPVNQ